jgi:hypothetical protein
MDKEQLKKAVAEVAKTAGKSNGQSAFAELIMEIIEPTHLSLDLFSTFLPVVQRQPGDELGRRVSRSRYPIQTMSPGATHLAHQISFEDQMTYAFDRIISGATANLWEIQSGEMSSVERMRTDLRSDLFDEIVSRVFRLLTTVWNATDTPTNYTDASATGITVTVLDNMIENVIDLSGNVKAIIGPRKALLPIYRLAQYREFTLGGTTDRAAFPTDQFLEFMRTNTVRTYLGFPLVEIPQVYRNRLPGIRDRLIPTDKVLVIGDDAGEIILYGGTDYQDYTDFTTEPANYVVKAWQAFAMAITDVEAIGVIKGNT